MRWKFSKKPLRSSSGTFVVAQFWIAYVAYLLYQRVANGAPRHVHAAMARADWFLALERHLHVAIELSVNSWWSKSTCLMEIGNIYYDFMHVLVPMAVLILLQIKRRNVYYKALSELVILSALALLVFWMFPVAPPRLLPDAGFVDTIARLPTPTSGGAHGIMSAENPLAAMPSLHVAWSAWSARWVVSTVRLLWVRFLAVVHVLITFVVVIATGNHLLIDGIGGLIILWVACAIVCWMRHLLLVMRLNFNDGRRYNGDAKPRCVNID